MGPLTDLPAELVAGWCLWFLGGIGLLIWFWRASAPGVAPPPPPVVIRQSGVRSSAVRPPRPAADAFSELQGLLDPDVTGTGTPKTRQ